MLFSSSHGAMPTNATNITVYHEYDPRFESLGLRDQDTGDADGDAYFVLRSLLLPIECASKDPAAHLTAPTLKRMERQPTLCLNT